MDEVIVRNSRRSIANYTVSISLILAFGIWMSGIGSLHNMISLVILVAFLPVALWQWIDRRPQVVVDNWGIGGRRLPKEGVQWGQIKGAYLSRVGKLDQLSLLVQQFQVTSEDAAVREIAIRLDNLEVTPAQLHELVQRRLSSREVLD
jgi:hypothetical protein